MRDNRCRSDCTRVLETQYMLDLRFPTSKAVRRSNDQREGFMLNGTLLLILLLGANALHSEPLRVLTWNVESGGNDPAIIAQRL